jgi:hypothetical protein
LCVYVSACVRAGSCMLCAALGLRTVFESGRLRAIAHSHTLIMMPVSSSSSRTAHCSHDSHISRCPPCTRQHTETSESPCDQAASGTRGRMLVHTSTSQHAFVSCMQSIQPHTRARTLSLSLPPSGSQPMEIHTGTRHHKTRTDPPAVDKAQTRATLCGGQRGHGQVCPLAATRLPLPHAGAVGCV